MDVKKLQERNTSMDIVRIVAVFTVLSVHFFLYNGFYSEPMTGNVMYIACMMRTLFGVCVPLFMVLSGYLMSQKTLSLRYYLGLRKILLMYLLACIACLIYKANYLNEEVTLLKGILDILNFSAAPYAWYIEMYIGLFLIIPFLNLAYNGLKTQNEKLILVATMVVITVLPTLSNVYNLNDVSWWANPLSSEEFSKVLPDWWSRLYPITYYFIGCYLHEFGNKLKTKTLLLLFGMSLIIFTSYNFHRSYGVGFKTYAYANWQGLQPCVLTVLLFILLSRIPGEKIPTAGKYVLCKVSNVALYIYLVSFIFDKQFYKTFTLDVPVMTDRVPYYFQKVFLIFGCSLLLGLVLSFIEECIYEVCGKIKKIAKSIKEDSSINNQTLIFFWLFLIAAIISLWKCRFGFGGFDESFYLTIPHRLSLGDALIRDEWHLSQMSGFLLLPWVAIFRFVTGGTTGILLATRYLYVILHGAVSVFAYKRLSKYGYFSVFATVLYFIFTPYNIMALSYNTMALDFLVLTGILLSTSDLKKIKYPILAGLTFAAAVLCCPYLMFVYVLFGITTFIRYFLIKTDILKDDSEQSFFHIKVFLLFTGGATILAIIFLIFVFSRIGISGIQENLTGMFSDPEHPQQAFTEKAGKFFKAIDECHPNFYLAVRCYGVLLLAMIIDKKRQIHRSFYLICSCCITMFCYFLFIPTATSIYYNGIIFPIIFTGLTAYILCKNKPKKLFYGFFVLGMLYAFCVFFTSNQYFYIISSASAITNLSSVIFIGTLLKEIRENPDEVAYGEGLKYGSIVMVSAMLIMLSYWQLQVKTQHCFWETGNTPETLQTEITVGPAKGISTTQPRAKEYESYYQDLQSYQSKEKGNILILSEKTWCYLILNDYPYGTFSAWLSGENQTSLERLKEFYKINPNKIPKYIYIPKTSKWDIDGIISEATAAGYELEETNVSYQLTKK